MRHTFVVLLTFCLWLSAVGADKDKPLPKDFKSLKALAEKGDARAQNELGERYFYGQGVLVNKGTSVTWYRKAAEQEYAEAQYNLGWMYWAGEGVKKDFRVAVDWFYKAAVQGFAKSQHYLGVLYWNGQGVEKDLVQAYYWLSIAAAGGHKKSIEWKPMLGRELAPAQKANIDKAARNWLAQHSMSQSVLAAGVLGQAETPAEAENTSQGLYIRILKEAGMEARAVSAEAVKAGALEKLDIFIIRGGSGTDSSASLWDVMAGRRSRPS